ncbi:MAG: two-component regulator propeller domain-containing protein, partial [Flavisolibacter sp.]
MKKSKNVTNTLFIQRRSILILLIAISFCLQAFAQNKLVYNHFSTEDGLATSDVKCVAQDKQGFIWVATSSGLQKFDGNRFINPLENKGSSKALSIGVRQIIADSNGRFFLFMMNNEYALFDPMSLEFKYIRIKSLKEVPIKADYQLYKDSKGHIFMCANNYGLLMYDSKRNLYTDQNLPIQIPPSWTVNGLYEDVKSGNYWICSDTGLAVYNIVSRKLFYKGHNPEHIPLVDGNYRAMAFLIDKENRYWLTHWTLEKNYEEHVLYYDANTKRIVNRPNGSNLGDYAQVRSLMEDYNGTIWLGGFEVLLTLYPRQNNFIQNKDTGSGTNGIKFSIINSLFQDREKNIWVSSDKGLFIVYPKGSSISNFQFTQKNDIYVVSFSAEKENEIWVAAWGKGILFFDSTLNELKNNTGSLPKFIMWLYADKKTNIVWASYADGT